MKNMNISNRVFYIFLQVILIIFFIFNCSQSSNIDNSISDNKVKVLKKSGNININIENHLSRTIMPNSFLPVDHYDLSGDGPNGETLYISDITGTTKSISSILTGSWTISAIGKNSSNEIIAKGSNSVTIIEDSTVDVNIDVNYLQENSGIVDIIINWPVSITVDEIELQINSDPTTDIYTGGQSAGYNNSSFTSGFHRLIFRIKNNGNIIAVVIESVHIYDNYTSSKTVNLLEGSFQKSPTAPSGITSRQYNEAIKLFWTDNSNVETGFVVERSETSGSGFSAIGGTDVTPLSANTSSFTDSSGIAGVNYYYRIKAVNSFGDSDYCPEITGVYHTYTYKFQWGTNGVNTAQFQTPYGIDIDTLGNVYVADSNNFRIQKFDGNGNYISKIGSIGINDGQLNYPRGIALDSNNNLYVADTSNHRIQKFDNTGNFVWKVGGTASGTGDGQFNNPYGIFTDNSGYVYTTEWSNNRVQKFDNNGNFLYKFGAQGSTDGLFYSPNGIKVGSNGNIYVAEVNNRRIQILDNSGNFIRKFGSYGSDIGYFNNPYHLDIDDNGKIYVTETNNNRVQIFDNNGNFLTMFGSSGSSNGEFNTPYGIAVDNSGNIYVVDSSNSRIQYFQCSGAVDFPEISYTNGSIDVEKVVTITSATPEVKIYYTTDGSIPDTDSNFYSSSFTVTAPVTIKALGVKNGLNNSTVSTKYIKPTLGYIVEQQGLEFDTTSWGLDNSIWFYGGSSFNSGDISDNQSSTLSTTISNFLGIKFNWKVSSETNFDILKFYINDELSDQISGSIDWNEKKYLITEGSTELKWIYSKDGSVSSGEDCGWIDNLKLYKTKIDTTPDTVTYNDVTVDIQYTTDSIIKQYKIDDGLYQDYSGAFTVGENCIIYAKSQDNTGKWSDVESYEITNIDKTGSVQVTINLVTPAKTDISFGSFNGVLDKNLSEILNVTATLSEATSWQWYLQGSPFGINSDSCSINSEDYNPGNYSLTVVATKNGIIYSGTIRFTIKN